MWYFVFGTLLLYSFIATMYYVFQEKIIFLPVRTEQNFKYTFVYPFTEYFLHTPDGAVVNMLWFRTTQRSKGLIVYCHGNAGNLIRWGGIAENFCNYGYDIMVFDYRNYGKSVGKIEEKGLHIDAQTVYNFAKKYYEEKNIIIYGRSLGTGVATHLASKNYPKKLILETPYFSLLEMAQRHAPIMPIKWLMRYPMRTDLWIQSVKCPIVIFHGTEDELVPYASGVKLKKYFKKNDEFITIPYGKHGDLVHSREFREGIVKVLN
jgi:fermentation-respiration switch protein FrsA (DUF1100 family)